jgi:hypothetical protein
MTGLLRLYPRAWRDRYGDEMLALLDGQPASLGDRLDLISGALDAHLHPQVRGAAAPDKEQTVSHRALALMAAGGGVFWIISFVIWLGSYVPAIDQYDLRVIPGFAIGIALMGVAIGELGTRPGDAVSPVIGHLIAVVSLVFAIVMPIPLLTGQLEAGWALMVMPIFVFPVVAGLAAARGGRNGVFPTWLVVAVVVGAVAAWIGFGGSTPPDAKWVAVLFGAAFVLVGVQGLVAPRRPAELAAG